MDDINSLRDKFVNSIMIYGDSIEKGDYHSANKCFENSMIYACKMQEFENWKEVFLGLLENENISVKMHIAYLLLPYDTKPAIKVLRKVSRGDNILGINSKITLREWRNKELKFPVIENNKINYKNAQELLETGVISRRIKHH